MKAEIAMPALITDGRYFKSRRSAIVQKKSEEGVKMGLFCKICNEVCTSDGHFYKEGKDHKAIVVSTHSKPAEQKPTKEKGVAFFKDGKRVELIKPKSASEEQPATRLPAGSLSPPCDAGRSGSQHIAESVGNGAATEEEKDLVNLILYRGYSSSAPAPSDATRMECLTALRAHVQREVERAFLLRKKTSEKKDDFELIMEKAAKDTTEWLPPNWVLQEYRRTKNDIEQQAVEKAMTEVFDIVDACKSGHAPNKQAQEGMKVACEFIEREIKQQVKARWPSLKKELKPSRP